ncbi:MAG: hypothetical protein HKN32_01680, partial [Flavobacteriales bacterium]|nr:hypothetical protein [Flavobacteriales bacterium]
GYTSTDEDIADLPAGTYEVVATDVLGCIYGEVFEVVEPEDLTVSFAGGFISCAGANDASIITTIAGGTPDYVVSWTGPNGFTSSSENISDLEPGCYDIEVTDANMCMVTDQFCIVEPAALTVDATIVDIQCYGDTIGSISIDVAGGAPNYTFSWVGPEGFTSDEEDLTNINGGQYDLQIVDQSMCVLDTMFTVNQNDSLTVLSNFTTPSCPGDTNGTIMVDVSGGAPDYIFDWTSDNGYTSSDQNIADLAADTYMLTITDALGCVDSIEVELPEPDSINVSETITNITCAGEQNGSIEIDIEGGTSPFSTEWTGPDGYTSSEEDISGLEAGMYELILADIFLCADTFQYEIIEPVPLEVTIEDLQNSSCPDSNDAMILLGVTGGEPDYIFEWIGPNGFTADTEDLENIGPGNYSVTITDGFGCAQTVSDIPIIALGDLSVTVPEDLAECAGNGAWTLIGLNDGGSVEVWLDSDGNEIASGPELDIDPEPGIYEFIYQASDGPCVKQDTVEVIIYGTPEVYAGEDLSVFPEQQAELGGDPTTSDENMVEWTPSELIEETGDFNPTMLGISESTEFIVIATDPNGCTAQDTVIVSLIPEIDVPTGFSPNADGQNDRWEIGNVLFYENMTVAVYNRWGDLVWSFAGVY